MEYNGEEISDQEWDVADMEYLDLLIDNSPDDSDEENAEIASRVAGKFTEARP